jgi:hypothetical protein
MAARSRVQRQPQPAITQPNLGASHLFVRPSPQPRLIDALLGFGGAVGTSLWTVTRKTETGRLAWGIGIALIGGVIAVEAPGTEVGNVAAGAAYANGAVVALSFLHPNLTSG